MSERVSHILGEAREGLIKMEVEMKLDAGEKRSLMLFLVTLCSNPRTRFALFHLPPFSFNSRGTRWIQAHLRFCYCRFSVV